MLSDEQMSKRWPFSLLNGEQMSNKVRVEHQPVKIGFEEKWSIAIMRDIYIYPLCSFIPSASGFGVGFGYLNTF